MSPETSQMSAEPDIIQLEPSSDASEHELIMSSTVTDFARKFLLEDPQNHSVIQWGPLRDCFIVKNTNEFAKTVLPRIFNHSNFASFVRQLNKYGFHKVKTADFNQNGDQTWTFQHFDFHGNKPENLQNIRRKATVSSTPSTGSLLSSDRSTGESSASIPSVAPHFPHQYRPQTHVYGNLAPLYPNSNSNSNSNSSDLHPPHDTDLKRVVEHLKEENEDLKTRARNLERNYETMSVKMKTVEDALGSQHNRMDKLLQSLLDDPLNVGEASATETLISMSIRTTPPSRREPLNQAASHQNQGFLHSDHPPSRSVGRDATESGHRHHEHYSPGDRSPISRFQESNTSSVITSASRPQFGRLGQVSRASLLQERESNRRLAAGMPEGSKAEMENHDGEDRLSSQNIPTQFRTASGPPSLEDRHLPEHLQASINPPPQVAVAWRAEWVSSVQQLPTFAADFGRPSVDVIPQRTGNATRRRSLSQENESYQQLPLESTDSSGDNLMGSPEQRAERGRVSRERRRRGSDSVIVFCGRNHRTLGAGREG